MLSIVQGRTLGDSHLISSDPRSRFGLVCDLLCCRGNTVPSALCPRLQNCPIFNSMAISRQSLR